MLAINWEIGSEIFEGYKTPNMYGLLFVSGLLIGYAVMKRMFKKENIKDDYLDKLVLYVVIATIVGARLGHVLFYGPYFDETLANGYINRGYFSHPLDILKVWEGGLASHGGAIALLIALYLYSKNVLKKPILWILDRMAAPIAIAAAFIRLGNLFNHEIVGHVTDVPWAFSFSQYWSEELKMYDPSPRHPTQLYEAICYLVIFAVLMYFFWKKNKWQVQGYLFGWFLILLFGARFFVEFFKMAQTARDNEWLLNTGQLLSIPFVLLGILLLIRSRKVKPAE